MSHSNAPAERLFQLAEMALSEIKKHGLTPTPKNYEIWYAHCNSERTELSKKLENKIKTQQSLTENDLEDIYDEHFTQMKVGSKINELSSKLSDELDTIMSRIEQANTTATSYGQSLENFEKTVSQTNQPAEIHAMIETLMRATAEMQTNNKQLEAQLMASRTEVMDLKTNLEVVRTESLTDPLTLLNNRKSFDEQMAALTKAARKKNIPLSLLLTDIDHFKKFNDTWGHQTGDQVLRLVAMAVKQNVKGQDLAARYGGEEFAVILPGTTTRSAITVADHIRRAVMGRELVKKSTGEQIGRVTISIGVATLKPGDSIASLIERADNCLYAAKKHGRNRVICETDPEVTIGQVA